MFEQKRIETLEKRNKELIADNKALKARVTELENNIKNMEELVTAADKYTAEHKAAMLTLSKSRERYDNAYKQMMKLKKDYESQMKQLIDELK